MRRCLLAVIMVLASAVGVEAQCAGASLGSGIKVTYNTPVWDEAEGQIRIGGALCRESGYMAGMEFRWYWQTIHREGCTPNPSFGTSGSCFDWTTFTCPESYSGYVTTYAYVESPNVNGWAELTTLPHFINCNASGGGGGMW